MIELRDYQAAAIADIRRALMEDKDAAPLAVLPTGAGKSIILTEFCRHVAINLKRNVLVVTHVKELLEQLCETITTVWTDAPVGLYSAGARSRVVDQITVAGVQSIYGKADTLFADCVPDVVLVDEAHLIPPDGDGMYRQLLQTLRAMNPLVRLVGLTATPYRLKGGLLYGKDRAFSGVCHETTIDTLVQGGYLAPLVAKGVTEPDMSGVRTVGGEWNGADLAGLMEVQDVVDGACDEMVKRGADRSKWLAFGVSVDHAHMVTDVLQARGIATGIVTGDQAKGEREETIAAFKAGELRCLVNVRVLTTGFDVKDIDLIADLAPTKSPGLHVQKLGRGLRIHPNKADCLLLDFAGNVLQHGPLHGLNERVVDRLNRAGMGGPGEAPAKKCPECDSVVAASARECPDCGHEFPIVETPRHSATAHAVDPMKESAQLEKWNVSGVDYEVYQSRKDKDAGLDRHMMRVIYHREGCWGYGSDFREYVCVEHNGFAGMKAEAWMEERITADVGPFETAADLVAWITDNPDQVKVPHALTINKGGRFDELHEMHWEREPGDDETEEAWDPVAVGYQPGDDDEPPF